MQTDTDTERIRRIAASDEDALRDLYAVYGQRLYAYALRLAGDPAVAEEILQDSLVAVWQGAGRFRGEGRVITWLLGIIHHKAIDRLKARLAREQYIQPLDENGEEESLELAGGPFPDEQAIWSEQRRLIRAGLDHLSLEHRLALELVFYQGLSLNEAAEVMRCPVGTIKSRLNYAKNSLRGFLNREGLQAEDIA